MKANPVANEPVLLVVLMSIITGVAARYGVKLDPDQAFTAAGAVLLVGGVFARQLVTPSVKLPAPSNAEAWARYREAIDAYKNAQLEPETVPPPPDPGKPTL